MTGTVITKKGVALIAKLLATKQQLVFTRAAVGTGNCHSGYDPASMIDLNQYRMDGMISDYWAEGQEATVVFQISSANVEEGFIITEAGLYAEDKDEGEVLYAYLSLTDDPQYVYAKGSAIEKFAEIEFKTIIGSIENVTAIISPSALATREMLDKLNATLTERIQVLTNHIDYFFYFLISCKYDTDYELVDLGFRCAIDGETVLIAPQMGNWDSESELLILTNQGISSIDGVIPGVGVGYGLQPATPQRLGGVKIGQGLDIDSDGTISVNVDTSAEKAAALVEANIQDFSNEEIQSLFTDGLTPSA